eukprot:160243_1
MATRNVSDDVIFSVTRKHNSRRKAYASYGRGTFFTRESGNLLQRDMRRTSGFSEKTVGIGQVKPKEGEAPQFTLIMKRKKKIRKPSQIRVDASVVMGSRLKIKKQIEAQTKYRLYRGDLSKLAQRRIWKIQQIRANYQKFLKKERKIAARQDDEDVDDDSGKIGNVEAEDLVEVD